MKVLLDIPDNKASLFMELVHGLPYAKVIKEIKEARKNEFIQDMADAFNDVNQYEQGKKKLKRAKDLLNEL